MKQSADAHMVKTTLASLQFLIAKPSELFDPYASLAALEHLVTVAKEKNDPESEKYSIVLPQCRPLVGSKALECSCKISSVETRSRDCKSHREGCEGAEPAERRRRAW